MQGMFLACNEALGPYRFNKSQITAIDENRQNFADIAIRTPGQIKTEEKQFQKEHKGEFGVFMTMKTRRVFPP
jgi:hypothetical protein